MVSFVGTPLVSAAPGPQISPPGTTPASVGISTLAVSGASDLVSVACPTSSTCYAVGDNSSYEPIVVTITNGVPGSPVAVSGADYLGGIACSNASTCYAVGQAPYVPLPGTSEGVVVPITNGVPGSSLVVPEINQLPGTAQLLDIACPSATTCEAVGLNFGATDGSVVSITNGVPSSPILAGTGPLTGSNGELSGVACSGATTCYAVSYDLLLPITNGVPGSPVSLGIAVPDLSPGIGCSSATTCYAAGNQSVVAITDGVVASPVEVPATEPLDSVACSNATNCEAVGGPYSAADGSVVPITDGVPGSPIVVPDTDLLNDVACSGPTTCEAVGSNSSGEGEIVIVQAGCTQQVVTDGSYRVSGCLTDGSGGDDPTQQQSSIDGIDVTASSTDVVDYSTSGDTVTSQGTSNVDLVLGSEQITVFSGVLSDSLSGELQFTIPKGTQLAGLTLSGTLTLKPKSLGEASGSVTVTLPAALGGGVGTLTFITSTIGGLSKLKVTVQKANFLHLFSLSNISLQFSQPDTWTVSGSTGTTASASTGGTTTTTFSGSLAYTNNALSTASFQVGSISLAGLLNISSMSVSYSQEGWTGSVVIPQSSGTPDSGTVSLGFGTNGGLSQVGISESGPISLFGVVNLNSFHMDYNSATTGTTWKVGGSSSLAGGNAGLDASLTTSNGVVSNANLTLNDVSFGGLMTIKSASASYGAESAAGCPSVPGPEVWCGSWEVDLPKAQVVTGVSGSLAIGDGAFAQGSLAVSGNVPLFFGVTLTSLNGSVVVTPPPTTISGGATITFGPQVDGASLLSLNANLTRVFPTGGIGGKYVIGPNPATSPPTPATLTALPGTPEQKVLGSASVTIPDTGATIVDLNLGTGAATGISFGSVKVTGSLKGSFTSTKFSMTGTTEITVPLGTFSGSVSADSLGIAACGGTTAHKVGVRYDWATGSTQTFLTNGCSETGF